ncbi:MAG: manganese efflux pump MntP family protein [Prevotella sp.]|jgi:putative Mn2+ efflux pump MntP|nr:manganese efflux pump MntP family protein [Prevotella sp.]
MNIIDLFLLAAGEAMDASVVSMAKGTATRQLSFRHYMSVGLWFGGFQAAMTLIGYFVGAHFASFIAAYGYWVAFALLLFVGAEMIKNAFSKDEAKADANYSVIPMLLMAVATSIDALAVGVSFAFIEVDIWLAAIIIGVVTFVFSAAGLKIGNIFGNRYNRSAELVGGIILIALGIKILLEQLWA